MRCFYMRSDDDGATWTEPVEITKTFEDFRSDYDWKVLATGPSHASQLTHGPKRGRLVVPVWLSLGTGGHAHRPSVTATIYSDDHGRTWKRGDIAVPDTPEFINPERNRRRAACRRQRNAEFAQRIEAASAFGHDQP